MSEKKQFAVIHSPNLEWPSSLKLPSRFRLFVAANVSDISTEVAFDFALAALSRGMVYFCSWGQGCERFHDIVDEVIAEDDVSERKFAGPTTNDVVMTTWHERESLEEALDFFASCAVPTDGLAPDSGFRLVICVGNPDWKASANRFLESAKFFV